MSDQTKADQEHVVLLDENNQPIGTAIKATVHTNQTPYHLAFSCFVFNSKGELLLQQRALTKKTWPGIWSNSFCGHPSWQEPITEAVKRRGQFELGLTNLEPITILPNFSYQATMDGIMENEFCPVYICFTDQEAQINLDEVADINWINWLEFAEAVSNPDNKTWDHLSIWCKQETTQIYQSEKFQKLWQQQIKQP